MLCNNCLHNAMCKWAPCIGTCPYFLGQLPPSLFDKREVHENCTVEIWESSETGEVSIGWWENDVAKDD